MLTEAQRAARMRGLGSSDISAVAGEHPYKNAHSVWLEKRGLVEPQEPTDATWLGDQMEPIIARRYAQEMGVRIVPGPGTVAHPEHPWALATTDYEHADGARVVECKWVGMRPMAHWSMDADGAPPYVVCQMAWQMFVRGIDRSDCAVIFGATAEFRIYEFTRDNGIIDAMFRIGQRFWQRVLDGEPPPIDETEEARQTLLALYPTSYAPLKPAPPEAERWFQEHEAADEEVGRWTGRKKLAANKLREVIGDAVGIEGPFGRATWKSDKNGVRTLRTYPSKERAA
jgi:putative phage-type endonuclease